MSTDQNPKRIALVGPPNAGKTTLFNTLTGTGSRPVNYPGATVDYARGRLRRRWGQDWIIVDTPGTYSLSPKSIEEQVTVDLLFSGSPFDALVLVVDATQLSRHLLLARQLIECGYPVVIALTMLDLVKKRGSTVDISKLQESMGVPVVGIDGQTDGGLDELIYRLGTMDPASERPHRAVSWSIARQKQELQWSARLQASCTQGASDPPADWTARLDSWLLHPFWGFVGFVLIMGALFTSIFWLAAPAMDLVSGLFEGWAEALMNRFPGSLWADFVGGGLIVSLGAILTFVPQIAILFFAITLLEDSGYLARAATLIDRPLTRIGLNGRSFVPLLSGYACAIPAMMAARTIPNRRERWLTLFVIPLMSCSARLPVYSLFLAFVFWGQAPWKPGLALTALYLSSLVVGALAAAVLRRWIPYDETSFFMLELPQYRAPKSLAVIKNVVGRTQSYLQKAGPVIFVFAVALWVATTFPHPHAATPHEKLQGSYAAKLGQALDPIMEPMGGDWRTGVALISAFAAREVFVSALGIVLQAGDNEASLLESMRQATRADGQPLFTLASVLGLILFFMIALQCMSTVAVAYREFGHWKYPLIQLVGFNVVAYIVAVVTVTGLRALGVS